MQSTAMANGSQRSLLQQSPLVQSTKRWICLSPVVPADTPEATGYVDDGLEDVCAEGDVILVAGERRMRVSSAILSMASASLRELLDNVPFQRSTRDPQLLVLDDDDHAVWVLIHLLHFTDVARNTWPHYELFGEIVRVAHRYGIEKVVPDDRWAKDYPIDRLQVFDLNILASAAYTMDNSFQFARITKALIQNFTEAELRQEIEPTQLRDTVLLKRSDLLLRMSAHVEYAVSEPQGEDTDEIFETSMRFCPDCRTSYYLEETTECSECGRASEVFVYCNHAVRLRDMIDFLTDGTDGLGIWPVNRIMIQRPCDLVIEDIDDKFKEHAAQTHYSMHDPMEGNSCPILDKLRDLEKNLRGDHLAAEGLELKDFKRDVNSALW